MPYAGYHWQPKQQPVCQPHEYIRNGTAKLLTLFHPATGQVRVKAVTNSTNATLHDWLKPQLTTILADCPLNIPAPAEMAANRLDWEHWRDGLTVKATLPTVLPRLRRLLVMDNLVGHKNPDWLGWCFAMGILPIYTPLSGSWLNMAESIQRLLKRRALDGTYPTSVPAIIDQFEAVTRHWNAHPTPFIWAGKRKARRQQSHFNAHPLGGSATITRRAVSRQPIYHTSTSQVTH
jgi:DDE superfamily endonuclease